MKTPIRCLLALIAASVAAGQTLSLSPKTTCLFAGQEAERTLQFDKEVSGTLSWSADLLPTRRPLVRREVALERSRQATLSFSVPPLRDGLSMAIQLRVVLAPEQGAPTEHRWLLRAMSPQAFPAGKRLELAKDLHLADPDKAMALCLANCRIEPRNAPEPRRLLDAKPGVLLVGPGARLEEIGLAESLASLAKAGWRVIVIEPAAGHMPLPAAESSLLASTSVVTDKGKWLYPQFGHREFGLALAAKRQTVVLEVSDAQQPTCWAEFRFASGGILVVTSLPIVSAWDDDPTARYLLHALLAEHSPEGASPANRSRPK